MLSYLKVVSGNTRAIGTISRSLWTSGWEIFWAQEVRRSNWEWAISAVSHCKPSEEENNVSGFSFLYFRILLVLQWKLSSFEIQSLPLELQGILAGGKRKLTEAFNGRQQDSSVLQMLSLWIHTCVLGIMLSFARDGGTSGPTCSTNTCCGCIC